MSLTSVKETRIVLNFDSSLKEVSTVAHELGYGYHAECLFSANRTALLSTYPMTLAETASLMCETLAIEAAIEAALEQAKNAQEELAILEEILNGAGQVVVDIYLRYLFEKEVFERRVQADLHSRKFWEESLAVVEKHIDRFCVLVEESPQKVA